VSRTLVVEDEPAVALAFEDDLRHKGHEVEVATDGVAGAQAAQASAFDLIVLAVMLPRMEGFTVCRELQPAGVRTPTLMLTTKTQEAEKVLGLDLGADDYITKPYGHHELRARFRARRQCWHCRS
jgi:DNA-binding response OmpR family regulator